MQTTVKRVVRKMLRQKQEWLGYSERIRAAWEELSMRLCEWLAEQLIRCWISVCGEEYCQLGSSPSIRGSSHKQDPNDMSDMWPLVWARFLSECKLSDSIGLEGEIP